MSVIRTSLSLISFGFTIYQLFEKLKQQHIVAKAAAGRNFGSTLVLIGIAMLLLGIFYHLQFMNGLRVVRGDMKKQGLIHGDTAFPPSLTLITAVLMLVMGIFAIINMVFHIGPFG